MNRVSTPLIIGIVFVAMGSNAAEKNTAESVKTKRKSPASTPASTPEQARSTRPGRGTPFVDLPGLSNPGSPTETGSISRSSSLEFDTLSRSSSVSGTSSQTSSGTPSQTSSVVPSPLDLLPPPIPWVVGAGSLSSDLVNPFPKRQKTSVGSQSELSATPSDGDHKKKEEGLRIDTPPFGEPMFVGRSSTSSSIPVIQASAKLGEEDSPTDSPTTRLLAKPFQGLSVRGLLLPAAALVSSAQKSDMLPPAPVLSSASQSERKKTAEKLLLTKKESSKDSDEESSLMDAAFERNVAKVKALLKSNANVNEQTKGGETALQHAILGAEKADDQATIEIITLLLGAKADVTLISDEQTALEKAESYFSKGSIVDLLKKAAESSTDSRSSTG